MSVYAYLNQSDNNVCPISLEQVDSSDKSTTITIVKSIQPITQIDRNNILIVNEYNVPPNTGQIYHINTYNLDQAYQWFITCGNRNEPETRKTLDYNELDRIKFRYESKYYLNLKLPKIEFDKLIDKYINQTGLNPQELKILRCQLTPQHLNNYLFINRVEAENHLINIYKETGVKNWLLRPSSYLGYDFIKINNEYVRMTEYIGLSFVKSVEPFVIDHLLIEKIYSFGYYSVNGSYNSQGSNFQRTKYYVCFFDILDDYIKKIEDGLLYKNGRYYTKMWCF